jgi:opacity protein-like surface antigen
MKTALHAAGSLRQQERTSMKIAKTCSLAVLLAAICPLAFPPRAAAQELRRFEIGVDYNFVRANAGPDMCGCFNMKEGGDAWLGWHFTDHLSFVGQGAAQHATKINGTTASLTLVSAMAGARVDFHRTHRVTPFAQALFGIAHGTGLLTPDPNTGLSSSANKFAFQVGGGVSLALTRAFSVRGGADYFYTSFENGVNQRQNNLRVFAGVMMHF